MSSQPLAQFSCVSVVLFDLSCPNPPFMEITVGPKSTRIFMVFSIVCDFRENA